MITTDKTTPENVTKWLTDFNTYKKLCKQFRKGWLLKPKQDEKHFLKSRIGIEEYAKLMTKLLPATTLARISKEKMTEINQYLKEHEQDILKFGYVSEETCLDHKTKTSAKGGTFTKVTTYLPTADRAIEVTNFVKAFTSKKDYEAAVAAEDRLAPLFPDLVLKYALKDDKNKIMAYPFIEGQTLCDAFRTENKLTLAERAAEMLTELHLRGKNEAEKMPAPKYTSSFKKYFFEKAGAKGLDEILTLFEEQIAKPLSQEPQSLVHGDAKAKNVLLTPEDRLWLIDLELTKKDTIHYDLYRFIDSAGLTSNEEDKIVKNVFEQLTRSRFYNKEFTQFRHAYDLNKITGDFFTAVRILDISKSLKDENQKQTFKKIAQKYYTSALRQLEEQRMQELSTKIRKAIRDADTGLEALTGEEYQMIASTYNLSEEGLTTMLDSENAQLRFPRERKRTPWLKRAGITAGILAALTGAPFLMGNKAEAPAEVKNIVNLEPLLQIRMIQNEDLERIKQEPIGIYNIGVPVKYNGEEKYIIHPFDGTERYSQYGWKDALKNPTILSNAQFDELFLNKTEKEISHNEFCSTREPVYHGLTKRIYDNIAKFSQEELGQFSSVVKSVIFSNLLDTPIREEYTKKGCSNLTLLPEHVYEKYKQKMTEENFEDGRWIDLVCQYLGDLIIQEKGDMTKAIVAYYNHHIYGSMNGYSGMTIKERSRINFYDYDKKEELCLTRYEKQMDKALKFFTRQALMSIAEANTGGPF